MHVIKTAERSIVLTRTFAAPRQKVFDALTQPERVPQWFQPKHMSLVTYQSDFKLGGAYRYVFQRPSGTTPDEMTGVYKLIDAPHKWVYTETYSFSPLSLLVTVALEEYQRNTVMTQTILYPSKKERDADFDAVVESADIYTKLDHYLEAH